MTTTATATRLAEQNDRFRKEGPSPDLAGIIVATPGISALPSALQLVVIASVQSFAAFSDDNDPHREHDFGAFDLASVGRIFWKIDYYADRTVDAGSEDPADPARCYRVLTVMRASEY